MKIKVTNKDFSIKYELNDSEAANNLYKQLPITTTVKDYSDDEKIFYSSERLNTNNGIQGSAKAGDLAYFAPWGDVVFYYKDFGSYPGLYILGRALNNEDKISSLSGTIKIEAIN